MTYRHAKRIIDVVVAAVALVMLAPLLAALAIAVRWVLGAPVLFRQQRPGLDGRLFALVKFRSMSDARDADGVLLDDARRLGGFGRWLRRTSLDELPELWNVLRGDMSLVGPRPLLPEYLELYSAEQRRRHAVRPGLTGLAQVAGRNAVGWPRRLALDVEYVDRVSLRLDLRIIWQTIALVVSGAGVSEQGGATMTRFTGND